MGLRKHVKEHEALGVKPATPTPPTPVVGDFLPLIYELGVLEPPKTDLPYRWFQSFLTPLVTAAGVIAPNRLWTNPFPLTRRLRFDGIGVYIYTGVAGGLIRLGFYRSDGGCYPNELLVDSGDLDASVAVSRSVDIDLTLDKGLYWILGITNIANIRLYYSRAGLCIIGGDEPWGGFPSLGFGMPYGALPDPYPQGAHVEESTFNFCLRLAEVL